MPSLFVIRGNDQGKRFELVEPQLSLGRDPSCGIQIHDSEVSRRHLELRREGHSFILHDLDSSNGTFVNGRRLTRHHLVSGDQVQAGQTLMLFTGSAEGADDDLTESVSIAVAGITGDRSQIIQSMPQEEGSRILAPGAEPPQNAWLARARSNLQVMYGTALAVSHTLDIDQLLQRIMELIFEWVEADRGCVMLIEQAASTDDQTPDGEPVLTPKVRHTRQGVRADEQKITISKTILDYVIDKNEGVLTSDARRDERWDAGASIVQMGVREAICVPMRGRYDVVGAIYIDTSISPEEIVRLGGASKANKFGEDHLKLMIAIAHQAALAVEDTRYYSAMVQAERLAAIGQTVATLSHHIKNILQGIRGGSYLIELGLSEHDEDVVGKGWKIVEKNQSKISTLVMDMLTFSKEREPDLSVANLQQVVGDVVELMQARAEEFDVTLQWVPGEPIQELVFDAEGVHRAVLNVVTNAIDAAAEKPPEGRVAIHIEHLPKDATVHIIIEDNGPGIPADQRTELFSPFISTKKGRGTGLGLPVSQKILKEHGGRILVDSDPAWGSRFTLALPAVPPEENSPEQEPKTGPNAGPKTGAL